MIAHLSGVVMAFRNQCIVVRAGDFGFEVRTSAQFAMQSRIGDFVELHTRMHVREDEISLFGFATEAELMVFDLLCSVSGVGPRIALAAIGALGAAELTSSITNADEKALSAIPGIGLKTARLIILKLSGKLDLTTNLLSSGDSDVVAALSGLGVSKAEAERLVSDARASLSVDADNSDLLREALRLRRNS